MMDASRRVQSTLHQCLDKDPSRLTTFPVPGFSASTYEAPDDVTEDTNALKSVAASLIKIGPSLTTVSNQYWMPDRLCKVCYDCSAAFSLFRRRHHCRLCGQIFCHECSNSFIDGTSHGFPGAIRVCKFCVRLNDAASRKAKLRENGHIADGISELKTAEKVILHRFDDSSCRLSGDYSCVKTSPFVFGPPADPNEVRMPLTSLVNSNPSDSIRVDQEMDPRSRTTATADLFEGPDTLGTQEQFHSGTQSRRRRSSVELLSAIESGGLDAKVPFHKWPNKAISEPDVLTAPEETQQELGTEKSDNLSRQRDIALDANMHRAYDRIRDGIMHSTSLVWNNLSEYESIELNGLVETLKDMAFIVTGHMLYSMKFRSIRGFNYASLVKVKSIARTASMLDKMNPSYDFKWLAGTVCHKHLSHKQMAREVTNPRILLFSCGISYDRSNSAGRMSSLDTLLEQEKGYMAILVEKISALEPDVIFVENAVSRHAQELLYERRISIVLNVKKEILYRIARHTGAKVLTSVDHVDRINPEKAIGSCRSFTVKSVPKVLDEGRANKTLQTLASVFTKTAAASNRLQTDTYLYVDGCDPLNGCTVLITGPSKQALRLLKRLTRDVLSMTYHLLLEAHVLSDLELSNNTQMPWKGGAELVDEECATWCTTSTLRVHDPGSLNPLYRQCVEAKHLRILACSDDDVSFGNFLDQELTALSLKCQNVKCNRLMADHVHVFSCRTGTITISFENLPEKNRPPFSLTKMSHGSFSKVADKSFGSFDELSRTMGSTSLPLLMTPRSTFHTSRSGDEAEIKVQNGYPTLTFSRWCRECDSVVTPFAPLAKYVYKYSFARFLEVLFSEAERSFLPRSSSPTCAHTSKESHVLFFNIDKSVARFDFSKQVSLRLDRTNFKHDNRTPHTKPSFAQCEHMVAKKEVVTRLETLKKLLDLLISTFKEKVQGINRAVKAFENNYLGHHTRIILEAVCIAKIVRSGDAVFSHRLALVGGSLVDALSACDAFQRALYLMACKWITCMLCLRDSIEKNLTTEVASVSSRSKSFTPGEFVLLSPTLLSPTRLPRMAKASTLPPRTIDTESNGGKGADLLIRGRSTGALDSTPASESITDTLLLSSSSTFATVGTSMRPTVPLPDASTNEEEEEEVRT
uniref:FYVE-type domain-containing protein n=1 Tax=Hyaloperonospora arabidopsidis (strain Emoy2) TaxID=559515 RepID=M4BZJ9_HYAAE